MCSRLRSIKQASQLPIRLPDWVLPNFDYNPNVAPTDTTPIIRTTQSEGLQLTVARFGLVHSWAKDTKSAFKYINAKSETVKTLPAFKSAYERRRCIIPVQGFYEWKPDVKNPKIKHPFYFSLKNGETLPLIGLWEYAELANEKIFSFTILTGPPNDLIAQFHDRIPMATPDLDHWLNLKKGGLDGLPTYGPDDFHVMAVDPIVNSVKNKVIPDSMFERS